MPSQSSPKIAVVCSFLTLVAVAVAVTVHSPPEDVITNTAGMKFLRIPASGPTWKLECARLGIEHTAIPEFYLQITEMSRRELVAADPTTHTPYSPGDGIQPTASILSWEDAVKLTHRLSAIDAEYEYRIPTVAQWRYAFLRSQRDSSSRNGPEDTLWAMADGDWEFATMSAFPSPSEIKDVQGIEYRSDSYVMDGRHPGHAGPLDFNVYAICTPSDGDDSIDEYTCVRLVLIPKQFDTQTER